MAITAIEVEGFGPFVQRQLIPIRPLTMIFGPNSTGKTSLFRAIHHAQHCMAKATTPGRESDLCLGFDLLDPELRYTDTSWPDKHHVRFTSSSTIEDDVRFILPEWGRGLRTLEPFAEVVTQARFEQYYGFVSEECQVILGCQNSPLLYTGKSGYRDDYTLNLSHPLFAGSSKEQTKTFLEANGVSLDDSNKRESFGVLDALIPGLRSDEQNHFLNGKKLDRAHFQQHRQLHRSVPEGGLLFNSCSVESWLSTEEDSVMITGEVRAIAIDPKNRAIKNIPSLKNAKFLIHKAEERSSVATIAGLFLDSQECLSDLKDFLRENTDIEITVENSQDDWLRALADLLQEEHEMPFGLGLTRSGFATMQDFVDHLWKLQPTEDRSEISYSRQQFASIVGWGNHRASTSWRDEDPRLHVDIIYSELYQRCTTKEERKAASRISRYLWACLKTIYTKIRNSIDDILHVGPLRSVIKEGEAVIKDDWYQGLSAWLPSSLDEEKRLPLFNFIFEQIGINYILSISRHRDPHAFSNWLRQGAPLDPDKDSRFPEEHSDLHEGYYSGRHEELFKQFATWMDIWTEMKVFGEKIDESVVPDCFNTSPLDRYRFIPISTSTDQNQPSDIKLGYGVDSDGVNQVFPYYEAGYDINQLGEGVRQVFPIIRAVTEPQRYRLERMVIIQQPELHLHPRMQLGLADVLIMARNCTVIETHSEHIILRVLKRIRESSNGLHEESSLNINPDDVSVIYLQPPPIRENPEPGSLSPGVSARRMRISEEGDFIDPWPNGFFEERLEDLFSEGEKN